MARRRLAGLSHVDAKGRITMVDVGDKPVTSREAVARGSIAISREALKLIRSGRLKKGDPLQAARVAGIMAAKQTSALIPLCHPLTLSSIKVDLTATPKGYDIEARVRTEERTGVEMEALTAVAIAALTIYDMVKAADRTMVIGDIRLEYKSGGRTGVFQRTEGTGRPAGAGAAGRAGKVGRPARARRAGEKGRAGKAHRAGRAGATRRRKGRGR